MTSPLYHHDQNPTRTANNTKPEWLIAKEEERGSVYQYIEMLVESEIERNEGYYLNLENAKQRAIQLEAEVFLLYEQWQKRLSCTHPVEYRETSYNGDFRFVGGDVIDTVTETVICAACGKDITKELENE